jgi:starch synthase
MADVLLEILPWLASQDAQFVLLSDGDRDLEEQFREAGRHDTDRRSIRIGYQEPLAHRILAGADMVLTPARFEPCGLTQLYAMRYGALPIARRVGGLADTVTPIGSSCGASPTGFLFDGADAAALTEAIARALALYREPLAWRRLQRNAMARNFGWSASAETYLSLYRTLVGDAAQAPASSQACHTNELAFESVAAQLADAAAPAPLPSAAGDARETAPAAVRATALRLGGASGYPSGGSGRLDPCAELSDLGT